VVGVEIGDQSGIVTDSFCFGFNTLKKEQQLTEDALLSINPTKGSELINRKERN